MPDDPRFTELWGMNNEGQTGGIEDADIDAPEAWDTQTGDSEVIVAVIDTGVDYRHPDLADNMWVNSGEIADNGIDDDENGYVDDVYGYDFFNYDGDPLDDHSHGTHCSGTIGGVGDNGIGVAGVAWDVRIMALKFLSADGYGDTWGAVDAIYYADMMGADVMSNSWGGGPWEQMLYDAIANTDVLFVAAAGNDSMDIDSGAFYPAAYDLPNILSVGATDHFDEVAWFSNWGQNNVDVFAPGDEVLSTVAGPAPVFMLDDPDTRVACLRVRRRLRLEPGLVRHAAVASEHRVVLSRISVARAHVIQERRGLVGAAERAGRPVGHRGSGSAVPGLLRDRDRLRLPERVGLRRRHHLDQGCRAIRLLRRNRHDRQ